MLNQTTLHMNFDTTDQQLDLDYCRASAGLRFANYIIDSIFFYFIVFCLGAVIALVYPSILPVFDGPISGRLIGLVLYGFVMWFIEGMSNGRSIGKLITGTKAVSLDGSDINFGKAFGRNFIRAIPFNAFSALGNPCNPWHDSLSETMVVDIKKVALQKQKVDLFQSVQSESF